MPKVQRKFTGVVKLGVFFADEQKEYLDYLKQFGDDKVEITLKKYKPYSQRSDEQNRYWHSGIVRVMSEEQGDTTTFWHNYLKVRFLLGKIIQREPNMDKIIDSGKFFEIADMLTTTSLNKGEFADLTSKVRAWASQKFNIYLLTPEEFYQKLT